MDYAQWNHLDRLAAAATRLIREKYIKGQAAHGGNLWEKDGILDMAIEEAIDQLVYLLTLKEQHERGKSVLSGTGLEEGAIRDLPGVRPRSGTGGVGTQPVHGAVGENPGGDRDRSGGDNKHNP